MGLGPEVIGAEAFERLAAERAAKSSPNPGSRDVAPLGDAFRALGDELRRRREQRRAAGLPAYSEEPAPGDLREVCRTCGGATVVALRPLMRAEAGRTRPGEFPPNVGPCPDCGAATLRSTLLGRSGIPAARWGWTLDTFEPLDGKRDALDLVRAHPVGASGDSLLLVGGYGRGKTHLAIGAALEALEREAAAVRFVQVPELLDELRSMYGKPNSSPRALLEALNTVDVLILDDVGMRRDESEWAVEKLTTILDVRLMAQRSTIVTTNLPGPRELQQALGGRIESRLRTYHVVKVGGRDMRGVE